MDALLYSEFRNFAALGDRRRATQSVCQFIASFQDESERSAWVREFLESGDYGHKIRHELYRHLVFPELLRGYEANDPWSLYFLAQTIQNIYDVREFHEQLDMATDYSLLSRCFHHAPDFRDVREQLLERVRNALNFAIHEWPSGLCCEIEEVESDLQFAKTLDTGERLIGMFEQVEAILYEARERANK